MSVDPAAQFNNVITRCQQLRRTMLNGMANMHNILYSALQPNVQGKIVKIGRRAYLTPDPQHYELGLLFALTRGGNVISDLPVRTNGIPPLQVSADTLVDTVLRAAERVKYRDPGAIRLYVDGNEYRIRFEPVDVEVWTWQPLDNELIQFTTTGEPAGPPYHVQWGGMRFAARLREANSTNINSIFYWIGWAAFKDVNNKWVAGPANVLYFMNCDTRGITLIAPGIETYAPPSHILVHVQGQSVVMTSATQLNYTCTFELPEPVALSTPSSGSDAGGGGTGGGGTGTAQYINAVCGDLCNLVINNVSQYDLDVDVMCGNQVLYTMTIASGSSSVLYSNWLGYWFDGCASVLRFGARYVGGTEYLEIIDYPCTTTPQSCLPLFASDPEVPIDTCATSAIDAQLDPNTRVLTVTNITNENITVNFYECVEYYGSPGDVCAYELTSVNMGQPVASYGLIPGQSIQYTIPQCDPPTGGNCVYTIMEIIKGQYIHRTALDSQCAPIVR